MPFQNKQPNAMFYEISGTSTLTPDEKHAWKRGKITTPSSIHFHAILVRILKISQLMLRIEPITTGN